MPFTSLVSAYYTALQYTIQRRCMCFIIMSLIRAKLFSMQRGYGHQHGILTAYIFSEGLAGEENYNSQYAARSRSVKRNIKVLEVKGQGHFAILWSDWYNFYNL